MSKLAKYEAKIIIDVEYEKEIIKFFKSWVNKYCGIECFAMLVILPNNDVLHLSTHSDLSKVYLENNYGLFDQPVIDKLYNEYLFYPWKTPNPSKIQNQIHLLREKIFNINSGTNFVRKIEKNGEIFHIIYCVSSHKKDPLGYFKYAVKVQEIFSVGDFAYNSLLHIFQENCEKYILPKISTDSKITVPNANIPLDKYIYSKDIIENISGYIQNISINDGITNSIIEGLKNYSKPGKITSINNSSHLRLIK